MTQRATDSLLETPTTPDLADASNPESDGQAMVQEQATCKVDSVDGLMQWIADSSGPVNKTNRRHKRATCSVCGQNHALTDDGKVWRHIVDGQQCHGGGRKGMQMKHEPLPKCSCFIVGDDELCPLHEPENYASAVTAFDRRMTLKAVGGMIDSLTDAQIIDLWEWLVAKFPKKKTAPVSSGEKQQREQSFGEA